MKNIFKWAVWFMVYSSCWGGIKRAVVVCGSATPRFMRMVKPITKTAFGNIAASETHILAGLESEWIGFVAGSGPSAAGVDGAVACSPESFDRLNDSLAASYQPSDTTLYFLYGHGFSFLGNQEDPDYGSKFPMSDAIVSETPITGRGLPRLESEIDFWGPRINSVFAGNTVPAKCVGLNQLGIETSKGSSQDIFGYGVKFVADIEGLRLFNGAEITDHSSWVKKIYYYLKTDVDFDGNFMEHDWIDSNGDGKCDSLDISSVVYRVENYRPEDHETLNLFYGRSYFFIDRASGVPRLAVALNSTTTDPTLMVASGFVDNRGYAQLDLNSDWDQSDYVYFSGSYQFGHTMLKDYEIAASIAKVPGIKIVWAGHCMSGKLLEVLPPETHGYTAVDPYSTSLAEFYEEGFVEALSLVNGRFLSDREGKGFITGADVQNYVADYTARKGGSSGGRLPCYSDGAGGYRYVPVTDPGPVLAGLSKATGIIEALAAPQKFELNQNYPNPFNFTTHISYYLPIKSEVTLAIYNINGQLIKTLVNTTQPIGQYQATWDGTDHTGYLVTSGIYIYHLKTNQGILSKRMLLIR